MANAYTDKEDTNYFFETKNSKLNETTWVLSRFFVDPLIDMEAIEK